MKHNFQYRNKPFALQKIIANTSFDSPKVIALLLLSDESQYHVKHDNTLTGAPFPSFAPLDAP